MSTGLETQEIRQEELAMAFTEPSLTLGTQLTPRLQFQKQAHKTERGRRCKRRRGWHAGPLVEASPVARCQEHGATRARVEVVQLLRRAGRSLRASSRLCELVRLAVNADWASPRAAGENQALVCLAEDAHAWRRVRNGLGSLFPLYALVTSSNFSLGPEVHLLTAAEHLAPTCPSVAPAWLRRAPVKRSAQELRTLGWG